MRGLYTNCVRLVAIAEGYASLAPAKHSLPEPHLKLALKQLEYAIADARSKMAAIRATGDIADLDAWLDHFSIELEKQASQLPGFTIRYDKWPTKIVALGPEEVEFYLQNFVDAGTSAIARIADAGMLPVHGAMRGTPRMVEPEKLHFLFRGSSARGRAIVAGSEADLIFRYDTPPPDALASLDSALLDEARRANVDISVEVAPAPGLSVLGNRSAVARFVGGKMTADVAFRIAAGKEARTSKLYIDFAVAGEYVHQMEIHIQIVEGMADLPVAPPAEKPGLGIAHAVGIATGVPARLPERRINLHLSLPAGQFRIGLTDHRGENLEHEETFVSTNIDRIKLEVLLGTVREALQGCYESPVWAAFDGSQAASRPPEVAMALARTVETIACAGWLLNYSLRGDPRIAQALAYIEDGAEPGTTLTISTEDLFLPWEILYPRFCSPNMTPEDAAKYPLDPALFWGARFAIETVQRGDISVGALRRKHISSPPKASINLNPAIRIPKAPAPEQPDAVHLEWATRLQQLGRLDGVHQKCQEIRNVLQNASDEATVYYLYCHGSSPSPFGGATEELQLTDNCVLKPHELAGGRQAYRGAPIVILNSCKAGAVSALTFTSFLSEFRKRGALGLIATTYSVPITFAGRFGESLVELCLRRHGSLAGDLLEARRHHLLERGNPVPLFYTLQCQLNRGPASPGGETSNG